MEIEVFEGDGSDLVADESGEEGEGVGELGGVVGGGDAGEEGRGAVLGREGDAVKVLGDLLGGVDRAVRGVGRGHGGGGG